LWKCLIKFIPVESYSSVDKYHLSKEEEKTQRKLMLNFVKENQTKYAEIIKAIADNDYKLAHRLAHTLKGIAGQIGKKQLQSAAAILEGKIVQENMLNGKHSTESAAHNFREQLSNLESELILVLDELAPLLAEHENRIITKITDKNVIREIFNKLEPLLNNNNTECLNYLDDIYSIPGAEDLAQHIEDLNFKLAAAALENLKNKLG